MNPIRRRPCADPGQKQVPGEWMTQKGIDSSRPVTEASHANKISIRVSHHRFTGTSRHSPRNGFTAYFALSPVTTLFDTVACASYRRLDANDWGVRTTRLRRPRQHHSSRALPASTASRPAFVTTRDRPSVGRDGWRYAADLGQARNEIFLQKGLDKPFRKTRSDLPDGQNQLGCPVDPATQSGHGASLAAREAGD